MSIPIFLHHSLEVAGGASSFVYEIHKSGLAGWRFGFISPNKDLLRRSTILYETLHLVSLRLYPRAARMGQLTIWLTQHRSCYVKFDVKKACMHAVYVHVYMYFFQLSAHLGKPHKTYILCGVVSVISL